MICFSPSKELSERGHETDIHNSDTLRISDNYLEFNQRAEKGKVRGKVVPVQSMKAYSITPFVLSLRR